MYLALLFIVLFIIGCVIVWFTENKWYLLRHKTNTEHRTSNLIYYGIGMVLVISCAVGLAACLFAFLVNHIDSSGIEQKYLAQYNSLTYQLENRVYEYHIAGADLDSIDNYNGVNLNNNQNYFTLVEGKADMYNQIREYNQDVMYAKGIRNNPWISIYMPSFWDDMPIIDLNQY